MNDQNQQKQTVVEKLKAANNILVTVSTNPSVDQLAACIGLTLLLTKMGKHATAVFSGQVPETLEFLKPEQTIEKNTDSLRDFIIAIDKAKADKLRYKVEDEVVKIFITPYRSSIGEKDLIYSQGDFNVDVVMALGVRQQQDIDTAITAHGRILHDATVISVNNTPDNNIGSVNWQDISASGVSELVSSLAGDLGSNLFDGQIATALLTGIVAQTDHFGNQKTTPYTMTMSATLLAAGANQQLVSNELAKAEHPIQVAAPAKPAAEPIEAVEQAEEAPAADSGPLKITHTEPEGTDDNDELPSTLKLDAAAEPEINDLISENGVLTLPEPTATATPSLASTVGKPEIDDEDTLADIEAAVHSPHLAQTPQVEQETEAAPITQNQQPAADEPTAPELLDTDLDSARKAVESALVSTDAESTEPLVALNAVPVNLDLGHDEEAAAALTTQLAEPAPLEVEAPAIPDYLQTPSMSPAAGAYMPASPTPGQAAPLAPSAQPLNPATNEPAPLQASPADQPFTMPLPPAGFGQAQPPVTAPNNNNLPPQGPPPPPVPPPFTPGSF